MLDNSPSDLDISTALPAGVLFQLPSSLKLSAPPVSQACDVGPLKSATSCQSLLPDLQVRKWYPTIGAKVLNQTYCHPHQTLLLRPEVWIKEGNTFQKLPHTLYPSTDSSCTLSSQTSCLWYTDWALAYWLSFMRPETSYTA